MAALEVAARETAMVLSCPSPVTVSTPAENVAVTPGLEVFNSTPTVLEKVLAATRSTRPSPFRSPAATPKGLLPPVGTACAGWKVPSPLLRNRAS